MPDERRQSMVYEENLQYLDMHDVSECQLGSLTKKKGFFENSDNFVQKLPIQKETLTSNCIQNANTSRSKSSKKKKRTRQESLQSVAMYDVGQRVPGPSTKTQAFFANSDNFGQGLPPYKEASPSSCIQIEASTITNPGPVITSTQFGQASYQKNYQDVIIKYEDSGDDSFECKDCGACFWHGEALKKKVKRNPIYTTCCHEGEVKLPSSNPPPTFLAHLLDPTNGRESILFRENIRVYNSMFAFTSMGAKVDKSINNGSAPYVFKICGQVHHLMGSVLPHPGECPKYAQLYVYDTINETSNRINAIDPNHLNQKIKVNIVEGLVQMFDEVNELTTKFRTVRNKFENSTLPTFNMTVLDRQSTDGKQYELPTTSEIGGLIVGDIGEFNSNRDIVVESNDGHLKRISKIHPKLMSLQYPLLFPYGEDGFRVDMSLRRTTEKYEKKQIRLTMIKYICHQLHDRKHDQSSLLKGGRLFQQYLVDSYATVKENRLDYIRNNQAKLRVEKRNELFAFVSSGTTESCNVGQRIFLPSSHTGSPRDMINNYQDAMAICRHYGNPDLFITFTCNIKWPEIVRYFEKKPGYKPEDRPDIICRIFKIKLDDMVTYIKSGVPFGKIDAHVCTVEFQKRGLPHAHILFWLHKTYKCYTSNDVDSIISAELPDEKINPKLFQIVTQYMIHGPCGQINSKSPCMREGKCTKYFPKSYNDETIFETMRAPVYRRRDDDSKFVTKAGVHVGNNFVVPYNHNLLLRYNAHINVESCSQSMLIKYLFKYINKGPDRARVLFRDNINDEIQNYLNCRYLTPHEAVWRLFEFSIHSRYPAVQYLKIHLASEQNIVFNEAKSLEQVLDNPNIDSTMLTAWFDANATYKEAIELTYAEFPIKFVWDTSSKMWTPRKHYQTIGRIAHVPPMVGELYYMRILLNIQKGCLNFNAIKTVHGITHSTHREACLAFGLLDDDKEWDSALTESSFSATSHQIRQLFVTLILFCNVSNPQYLLDAHWRNMSDDILHKIRLEFKMPNLIIPEQDLKNSVLYELEKIFNMSATSLKNHHLSMPNAQKILELNNKLIREELDYDCEALKHEHSELIAKLNSCQRVVYNNVIEVVEQKKPTSFFVYGSGGTGKTFLWHTIIAKLRSEGKIVLAVASSGIASLLLPNGRTTHSRFKIPFELKENSICSITKNTHLGNLFQKAELIIWDEAPICNKYCFEALDRALRDILSTSSEEKIDKPFGGKPILLGGDFRQILPVVQGGTKEQIIQASLNNSYLWHSLIIFRLTENMRLSRTDLSDEEKKEIVDFASWMLQIGEGKLQSNYITNDEDTSWISIPKDLLTNSTIDPIESIFLATYPNFNINYNNAEYLKERAIVTPRNLTVHDINKYAISLLPGDKTTYFNSDTIFF